MRRPRSLRERLQATSFLAVLAGYGVLLLLNQGLNVLQRRSEHQQLRNNLEKQLLDGSLRLPAVGGIRLPSGTELSRVSSSIHQPTQLKWQGQERWLVSVADGLEVRQNITAMHEAQVQKDLLLVAVAGFSSLVTSTLLERALRQGLEHPLGQLSRSLEAAEPHPAEAVCLVPLEQPEELQPIVTAYNALQQRLVEAWQQQRTFVDGVAHELRTPLTLIDGYAQRLQRLLGAEAGGCSPDGSDRSALLEASRMIKVETARMTRLVRDQLDCARLDAGRLVLELQPMDAGDALLSTFERLAGLSEGRLKLNAPLPEHDLRVCADPERLSQCLTNLVENALRYAPAGSPVQLSAERRGPLVVLHVCDQGAGVPADERQRIFELFWRGSSARSAGVGGSGIGLTLVQQLIQLMGGAVEVHEAKNGGADFQLLLSAADRGAEDSASRKPTPRTV